MLKMLLEAALSGLEVVDWQGKQAIVLHRDDQNVYLFLVHGAQHKQVVDLDNPAKSLTSRSSAQKSNPTGKGDLIVVNYFGELRPAEVLGISAVFSKVLGSFGNIKQQAGYGQTVRGMPGGPTSLGGYKSDVRSVPRAKGDVEIRVKFLDWGTTKFVDKPGRTEQDVKTIVRDAKDYVALLTVVDAKKFDQMTNPPKEEPKKPEEKKPEEPKKPGASKLVYSSPKVQDRMHGGKERVRRYGFDPRLGFVPKEEKEVEEIVK